MKTTKRSITKAIFDAMILEGKSRKEIVAAFVEQAGMTQNSASLYHHLYRREWKQAHGIETKTRKLVKAAPQMTLEEALAKVREMTNKQLVEFYNKAAGKNLVKFENHTKGVMRIEKELADRLVSLF